MTSPSATLPILRRCRACHADVPLDQFRRDTPGDSQTCDTCRATRRVCPTCGIPRPDSHYKAHGGHGKNYTHADCAACRRVKLDVGRAAAKMTDDEAPPSPIGRGAGHYHARQHSSGAVLTTPENLYRDRPVYGQHREGNPVVCEKCASVIQRHEPVYRGAAGPFCSARCAGEAGR